MTQSVIVVGDSAQGQAIAELARTYGAKVEQFADVPTDDISADIVVEGVAETWQDKVDTLAALARITPAETALVTTTSTLSVTDLALAVDAPSRLVGLHLALPADVRQLAELVAAPLAATGSVEAVQELAGKLERTVAIVGDRPGLLIDRLYLGYLNQAISMVSGGYATKDDVDAAMRFGCGYPVGPIAAADAIGLDVLYDSLSNLFDKTGEQRHAPDPLLGQLVQAGRTGQKAGAGFYTYAEPGSTEVVADKEETAQTATPRAIKRVGVVGSGTMATGIIEVFARSGYAVTFVARSEEKVARVQAALTKSLDKQVAKGRVAESVRDETLARVTGTSELADLAAADLVLEAIVEDLNTKSQLFRDLDRVCRPGAVLATTTSSLPVIAMAQATSRPADVVGLHFFNPAPIMKLVEVVSTVATAPDIVATALDICATTKKIAVECGDRGGFIVNALLFPYLNDAVRMVESHYATATEIDAAVKAGLGLPMGAFQLLDVVGNDVSLAIEDVLLAEFRDPDLAPAKLLRDVVAAGYLGRKSGRGFYDYSK